MKRRRVLRGILAVSYNQAGNALIQLAMVPALATSWGLPLYGQWLLLATVPIFLAASDLGFGSAAGNALIGQVAQGDSRGARTTFQSAQAVVLCCSLVVLLTLLVLCTTLPDGLLAVKGGMGGGEARAVLFVLCVYGVVAMQSNLYKAVMRAHGAFALSTSFEATVQLVEGTAIIAIAINHGTPLQAAMAYLAVRLGGVAGHIFLAFRRAEWLKLGFRDAARSRMFELLRPAIAATVLPLAHAGYLQGTALAVGASAGAAAVPIFTSLRTLSRIGLQVLMSITLPILPEFTAEHARGNRPWLAKIAGALTTFNCLVGLAAAAVLVILGNPLLDWWTKGIIVAPQSMIVFTATAMVASMIWNPLSYLLFAVNRHEGFSYTFGAAAIVSVLLTYVLVRHLGVTGAAAANLLLDISMTCCSFFLVRRLTGPFSLGPSALRMWIPRTR